MLNRIAIIGAGAIGCVVRGLLTKAGHLRLGGTLNGYVAEQGRGVGVPTPFNTAIVAAVTSFPVGAITPQRSTLEPLLAMLR